MSDIYINGESLKVDKKFDSVLIEGIDEVVNSLRPKIVIGGSGGGSGDGDRYFYVKQVINESTGQRQYDETIGILTQTTYASSVASN